MKKEKNGFATRLNISNKLHKPLLTIDFDKQLGTFWNTQLNTATEYFIHKQHKKKNGGH